MSRYLSALVLLLALLLVVSCASSGPSPSTPTEREETQQTEDGFFEARQQMVEFGIIGYGIEDQSVIEVMRRVPRHEFVPDDYLNQAYANHPLPIGHGQTISQPFIVALMTQELAIEPGDKVLEIGTGSGYQAAILAELGVEVYSIEIIEALATEAQLRLERLGYSEIQLRHADGYFGWSEQAPFDAIIVTAAPDHVPQPLLDQLAEDGVMVIPVGPVGGFQELWRITRDSTGEVRSTSLGGVRFVPLTGTAERGGIP
jgi:protein-L-isoaspartate(D-aspartate) O-methyltransferase